MLNKDISPVARYCLLGIIFLSGANGLMMEIVFRRQFLLIPTTLMGGTLPVIGKALANENHSAGSPLGLLYGVNTFGGVTGVIGATFFLLGTAGASLTLDIVSIVNTLIGLVALLVFGKIVRIGPVDSNPGLSKFKLSQTPIRVFGLDKISLAVFFLAGFAALSLEVHWTRILAYVVGSHGYAFGIILAAFLCGIALGSTLVARFVDRLKRPALWLGSTQLLIAGTAFAASIIMFRLRGLTGWLTLQVGDSWDRFITAEWDVNP